MLSRLLTIREQVILAGLAVAIFTGAMVLGAKDASPSDGGEVILDKIGAEHSSRSPQVTVTAEPVPSRPREIGVGIVGAVRYEGLHYLPEGARVADLLESAGGETPRADLSDLNLAALLIDASTLEVPRLDAPRPRNPPQYTISGTRALSVGAVPLPSTASAPVRSSPSTAVMTRINLNTATQAQLETLPGIGPATAQKIIAHRRARPFRRVDDLLEVSGIGPQKFSVLQPLVRVR